MPETIQSDYLASDREALTGFVKTQLASFPMTRAEACALCDANNGAMLFGPFFLGGLSANIQDTPAAALSEKWACDAMALSQRIFRADRGTQFALTVACADFWRISGAELDDALRDAGFTIQEEAA